jgi:hypothetical protein
MSASDRPGRPGAASSSKYAGSSWATATRIPGDDVPQLAALLDAGVAGCLARDQHLEEPGRSFSSATRAER